MTMKHPLKFSLLLLVVTMNFWACSEKSEKNGNSEYSPITQQLIDMVEADPQLKTLLTAAIEKGSLINPDRQTNPAQTLDEYYDFIEWSTTAMPWSVLQQPEGTPLFDCIDQSLNYFYFINDIPLDELEGKELYNNSLQYAEPYRSWLIDYCREWGRFLSTPESWNDDYLNIVYENPIFGLQDGWYEDPSNWHSFNDFFCRYLKSPDQRPIASPDDSSVVCSPADSEPQGVWEIDANSDIVQKEGVVIKSKKFNSVKDLLGPESAYRESFANGTLTHSFLNVFDYHRYHFPLGGVIREINLIPGDEAVGGEITWSPEEKKYLLACDTPGWQTIETRGCVILETDDFGYVALLPIGMSQVSSVNFEANLKVGNRVNKGDMLGYFLFGGSDFVVIFQKDVKFTLTSEMESSQHYKHLLMGEELGKLTR